MNDGPIDRTVYFYDEAGRHIRTMQLNHDGTQTVLEVCSYDADGRKTKVRFLFSREADSECKAGNACGASTGYGIEGTDTAYGAPGATTMTVTYDEKNLPAKVLFHDANHRPLNCVIFTRDTPGRLLSEEMHQGERSPFQGIVDQAPPERREEMAAMFKQVLGETLSTTTYAYDAQGRLVKREHRMGSLGGDCTTYRYDAHDDPVEETVEHRSREGSFDEIGNVHYSSDRVNVQHNRLEYRYDAHGNWTERIVSFRPESEPDFQRSNIERRAITYGVAAPAFLADRLDHFLDRCIPEPIASSGFFPFGPISTRYCLSSGLLNRNFFSQCEALRYSCEHLGWVYGFSERHKVKSYKAR